MAVVKVGEIDELQPGTGKVVQAGGRILALFNVNGTFYALDNNCTHAGGPLGDGQVDGTIVTCPWHGSRFDITTGEVIGPPARRPVATHPVQVENDQVLVELP